VETRRLLAKALAAGGRLEEALRTLDEASAAAARDPEAAYLIATEYLWLKKADAAERLFAGIVAARPMPQTRVLIGRTLRDAGEYDRARTHLEAAVAQDPEVRRAHYSLGLVLLADARGGPERIERAIAEFRAELRLDPQDALANDQLGTALLDVGRPEEARPPLEAAVRADARSLYLHHLGRCQLALDRPAEAAASLRRALTVAREEGAAEADLEKVHYLLGLALRKVGQAQEAAAHLAEAGRIAARQADGSGTPPPAPLMEVSPLAELPLAQRRGIEGRVKSGLARAHLNLGVMRAQARDFAGATVLLEKAAELQPDLPRVQYSLGVAAFNAGQYQKAADALTRALGAGSDVAETNAALGMAYFELDRLPEAEAALRRALQARPDEGATRDNLARVLERIEQRRKEQP
jgi:tetratricopeptide (TPR) repeat protein